MSKKSHGCLFSFVIIVLILVLLVVGICMLLKECSLRQLGLENKTIANDQTIEDIGLADVRISEIYNLFMSITTKQQLDKVAPNAYTDADRASARIKFQNTLLANGQNDPRYRYLLVLSSHTTSPICLTNAELACVIDQTLQQFYVSPLGELLGENLEAVQILQTLQASIVEMDFYRQQDKTYMKTVIRLNVSELVVEVNQMLSLLGFAISDNLYCTLTNEISVDDRVVDNEGMKQEAFTSVCINDQEQEISLIALDALFKVIAESGEEPLTTQQISVYVCKIISLLCGNIGVIGSSSNALNYNYGIAGIDIDAHTVTFLPEV